jgi:SAM-dependent methyltransferase
MPAFEECHFYHSIELPGHGLVKGCWDLRGRIADYTGKVPIRGKRCLDVGAASGFLSFELEKLGAEEVVSFDADDPCRVHEIPFAKSTFVNDRASWLQQAGDWLRRLKNSYRYCHTLLGSRAKPVYGNVYDMPVDQLGRFDVAVVGMILVHLRDPVGALASVSRVLKPTGELVITEGMLHTDEPVARIIGNPAGSWWVYSVGLYRKVLDILDFQIVRLTKNKYRCLEEPYAGDHAASTIVARRKAA